MAKKLLLDLPVEFGNLSVGDKTCRVGVKVDRSEIDLERADLRLCEKRLTGMLVAKPRNAREDQPTFVEEDYQVDGIFDVKGFAVSKDHLTFGATFLLGNVDLAGLAHFPKRSGRLVVRDAEAIPEGEANGNGRDEE